MKQLNSLLVRSVIGLLIVIASLSARAQETCLPDTIVAAIVDELIVKDGLVFKLNISDSTLVVYRHMTETQAEEIRVLKISSTIWPEIVRRLERSHAIVVEEKDREIKRSRRRTLFMTILWVATVIILL